MSSLSLSIDGSYSEHGREIFDEEADPQTSGGHEDKKHLSEERPKVKRKVAKPGSIKAMVMSMKNGVKKKKEVCVCVCVCVCQCCLLMLWYIIISAGEESIY